MPLLKTFGIWFLLGTGLLFSGLLSIEALRELRANPSIENAPFVLGVCAIAGGIFVGLVALAIRRLGEAPASSVVLGGEALVEYAARLGVSLKHVYDSNGSLLESELQRRVLDAEKSVRERRGYCVAIGAAVVAALSAVAAWIVHLK
jgi:hypothetical protein